MVGLRRTNACATCRRRKVKCDEVRPVCGQCAKKGRPCNESRPPDLIWVKSKQSRQIEVSPSSNNKMTVATTRAMIEACHLLRLPKSNQSASNKDGQVSESKKSDAYNEGYQGLEFEWVSHNPMMLPLDQLRCRFSMAFEGAPFGLRLSTSCPQWIEIPRHLGASAAMDDAVDCLLRTHGALARSYSNGRKSGDNLHFASYHKALKSLQSALSDTSEHRKSTTLCAIAMLCTVEGLGRKGVNYDYVRHSGGISAFMKAVGPACARDDLGKSMIPTAAGLTIVDAYMNGKTCLLDEPEWSHILGNWVKSGEMAILFTQNVRHSSTMSTLLVQIRDELAQKESRSSLQDLFRRAIGVQQEILCTLEKLNAIIRWDEPEKCVVTTRNSKSVDSPIRIVNWFPDRFTAQTVLYTWTMTAQIHNIVDRLHSHMKANDAGIWTDDLVQKTRQDSKEKSHLIFSSLEYTKSLAPMGSQFIAYPICVAWQHAPTEWKDWMVRELNDMTGPMTSCYDHEILDYVSSKFAQWKLFDE